MVYFNLYGNLGNLMFQYATAVSLGRGRAVGVTRDERTLAHLRANDVFASLSAVSAAPPGTATFRQDKCNHATFPPVDGRDILIDGYFQSESYFDRDLVYGLFRPPEARVARLCAAYGDWLSRPGVTGVSVRRGDYMEKAAWHPFVGERYFRDCLARLAGVGDFVVCSDDIPWCRAFFPKAFPSKRFLFVEGESPLDQMAVHALCANNVVSNSSFSWWGAWLAKERRVRAGLAGAVLAPSMWYGYIPRRDGADWSDVYFEGTEVVKNGYSPGLWLKAHWSELVRR